jgi:hypothetical protein
MGLTVAAIDASEGSQRMLRGVREGGVWRFHGESGRGPKWRRWQVTTQSTDGGFELAEEVSERSGPWREAVRLRYLRSPVGPASPQRKP